jgi:hypothetical protein
MIRILRRRVAPSDRAKEIEVLNTWKWLPEDAPGHLPAHGLRKGEERYEKAQKFGLPEATGVRPVLDFINAIEPISEKFRGYWSAFRTCRTRIDSMRSPTYNILDKFRNRMRLQQLQRGKSASRLRRLFAPSEFPLQ